MTHKEMMLIKMEQIPWDRTQTSFFLLLSAEKIVLIGSRQDGRNLRTHKSFHDTIHGEFHVKNWKTLHFQPIQTSGKRCIFMENGLLTEKIRDVKPLLSFLARGNILYRTR